MKLFFNHRLSRTTLTRGLAAASQFALRAYPTRPLRGGRINVRVGRARTPAAPFGRGTRPACPPHGRAALVVAIIALASLSTLTTFAADPAITVSARQRYPWNGLVDINFTITGDAGTKYDTSFTAKDMVGNTNIAMRTIRKSDGTAATATEQLLPGTYNWVWDAVADLPKDFQCDRVTVTGTAVDMSYSVKFNANGGTGTMLDESFTYGTAQTLTANAFTRTGYTFQGWATSASGAKVYNDKQSVSNLTETSGAVVNLYAVWQPITYTVKFNANGGTGTMANQSFTYGKAQALRANAFKYDWSSFQGWATSANSTTVKYKNKQSVSNLTTKNGAVVNLYAVWYWNGPAMIPSKPDIPSGSLYALSSDMSIRAHSEKL